MSLINSERLATLPPRKIKRAKPPIKRFRRSSGQPILQVGPTAFTRGVPLPSTALQFNHWEASIVYREALRVP